MTHPKRSAARLAEYLTVSEAAEVLGVSPWTLRNWDKAGKLKPRRHPKNGYRIYKHEDLTSLLEPLDNAQDMGWTSSAQFELARIGPREHVVQFYETDAYLVDAVCTFVGTALEAGEAGIIVATREHRAAIQKKLKSRGLNVAAARARGDLLVLDAADTLARFMVDGAPDARRFLDVVGNTVARMTEHRRRLRAFGEMVALLWGGGNRAAAVRLEGFWSDLAKSHSFALMCGYPMHGFGSDCGGESISDVCSCHSRVMPAESFAALQTSDDQRRAIAHLQQKAMSLEAEIAHRNEVEEALARREQELADLVENAVRAEEKLRVAVAAAERANRAKDRFLAVLSHELRTPLTPVLMSVAALESEPGLTPRTREDLAMIRRNLALETQLIDDLLDLSRIVNGKMSLNREAVDLHALVRNVVEMVAAEDRIERPQIDLDLAAGESQLIGDSARLHQVVWNLLKNAVKFTPESGGRIVIRSRNEGPDRLVLEVQDNGIGIEADDLPRIFNAFAQGEQGDHVFGGLGLGLTISKVIVDMHKGSIRVRSDGRDRGACFTVELPTSHTVASRLEHTEPNAGAAGTAARPLQILLVDDHVDTLRVLRRILEGSGHRVTTAGNVADAVRSAADASFDILISDIGLPDGTGLDLIRQLRASHPRLRGIALTGFGAGQDLHDSEEAGFSVHLTKPIEFKALEAAISSLCGS